LHEAQGYALRTVTLAKGNAERRIHESLAYSNRTVINAVAQAAQFTNQFAAYSASPRVYTERSYLQALERGITNSRKYVLATTNTEDLLQFNLEDKIRGDLINDLTIPSARK
jgi:membrane protease subunit HflK